MAIFRKEVPLWLKIIYIVLLFSLFSAGFCISIQVFINFGQANRALLNTLAYNLMFIWCVGSVVVCFCALAQYILYETPLNMFCTSLGIVLLAFVSIASIFLPNIFTNTFINFVCLLILVFFFYDIFRSRKRK